MLLLDIQNTKLMNIIAKIYRKINKIFHPILGEIWCLHRILPQRSICKENREIEITPDYLQSLICEHLRRGYRFVSLDDLLQTRNCIPTKKINISFDDGFVDVYKYAFPLFKQYHIPFTIYLTSDFPERKAFIWWYQLEKMYNENLEQLSIVFDNIYNSQLNMPEYCKTMLHMKPDYELTRQIALSWEQLREMVESGLCTIGAHTVSHACLNRLSLEQVWHELSESKKCIEQNLKIKVKHMSYPHTLFNADVYRIAQECGYMSAALSYGDYVRKGADLYQLSRKYIVQE